MKNLIIPTILMLAAFIIACETEDPIDEKAATVISSSAEDQIEEQPNKRLDFMDRISQDFTTKHGCFVGETIFLEATVLVKESPGGAVILKTNNDLLWFRVDLRPLIRVTMCEDYYKTGETYVFPLLIVAIFANTGLIQDWREGNIKDVRSFNVYSEVVITEELEEELREADCWKEER